MLKYVFNIVISSIVFATTILSSHANSASKILVETIKVERQLLYDIYPVIGRIENLNSKSFFAKTKGTIDIINEGTKGEIKKDDVIVAINYNIAETIRSEAELKYKLSKAKLEKNQKLFLQKVISQSQLDEIKIEFETVRLNLEKALETYESMVIKAPFDGRMGIIKYKLGDNINIGDFLFTIISPGFKEIMVSLPQKLYPQISYQSEVNLINDLGVKTNATIVAISPYISLDTGNFDIKLEVNEAAHLLHGSYTDIEIIYNKHEALVIPEAAILKEEKGNFIYLVHEGKVNKKYLTVGSRLNGMIELVNSDLIEGDEIVIEGLTKISEGTEVDIKTNKDQKNK